MIPLNISTEEVEWLTESGFLSYLRPELASGMVPVAIPWSVIYAGIGAIGVTVVLIAIIICLCRRRNKKTPSERLEEEQPELHQPLETAQLYTPQQAILSSLRHFEGTLDPPVVLFKMPIQFMHKDFDTFKHTMITAMQDRIPGWTPTSEADLDLVLIELISKAADELSDYQDRVMNEAYLHTARKRVSIARHARLMDYPLTRDQHASIAIIAQITFTQK